jgi:uncharacterized protein (TIGR02217 family)
MSNEVFPSLPGLKWNQAKTPVFSTRIQRSTSGREAAAAFYQYPVYTFDLSYEVLRDDTLHNELKQLLGFYLARQGAFESFLYRDPSDYQASNQVIATGDGNTLAFQMIRTYGAGNATFVEPILNIQQPTLSGNELVENGSFSTTANNWTGSSATLSSVANGQAGNALQVLRTLGFWQDATQIVTVAAGNNYKFSGYVKSGNSGNEDGFFYVYDGNDSNSATLLSIEFTSSNAWVQKAGFIKPSGSHVCIDIRKNSSTSGAMLFDTISLQDSSTIFNVYINGNLQQAANYSVSYLNSGILTFNAAPANGAVISSDFSFYYRVRFSEYAPDLGSPGGGGEAFSQFMHRLWEAKSVTLVTRR